VSLEKADQERIVGLSRHFARNLVSLRRRVDLSQQETADRAGLHRTEISLLERGLRVPKLDTIVRLAAGVEAEPCDLLSGMAWRLDRDGTAPEAGGFEVKVGENWELV